jgi:hypothetical protein
MNGEGSNYQETTLYVDGLELSVLDGKDVMMVDWKDTCTVEGMGHSPSGLIYRNSTSRLTTQVTRN